MSLALDTSVLVAALIEPHPFHPRAIRWLDEVSAGRIEAECAGHALAETYSVLTRFPIDPPIPPPLARVAIERLVDRVGAVGASARVYRSALRRCAERNLRSGAIFDALHLVTAERRRAAAFVTFNPEDFERLRTEASPPIVVPPDPPAFTLPPGGAG